jgi:hypothetical protein
MTLVLAGAFAAPAASIYLVVTLHDALLPLVRGLGRQWSAKLLQVPAPTRSDRTACVADQVMI